MEYVIRAVWRVYATSDFDLERMSEIVLDNISDASCLCCRDENFFPKNDRDVYFWEDGNGFTIDCSRVTNQWDDEDAAKLADACKQIFEEAGANMNDVDISYERI